MSIANIPTQADLLLTSNPNIPPPTTSLPPPIPFENTPSDNKREDWMLDPLSRTIPPPSLVEGDSAPIPHSAKVGTNGEESRKGEFDFFSEMGTDRPEKQRVQKPDPDKVSL